MVVRISAARCGSPPLQTCSSFPIKGEIREQDLSALQGLRPPPLHLHIHSESTHPGLNLRSVRVKIAADGTKDLLINVFKHLDLALLLIHSFIHSFLSLLRVLQEQQPITAPFYSACLVAIGGVAPHSHGNRFCCAWFSAFLRPNSNSRTEELPWRAHRQRVGSQACMGRPALLIIGIMDIT